VAAVARNGKTELLFISGALGAWHVQTLASVNEPIAPNSVTATLNIVTCPAIGARTFVFGLYTDPEHQPSFRLTGVTGIGGVNAGGAWAFAIAPGTPETSAFQIWGSDVTSPVFVSQTLEPSASCTA
jgi:hypothetical protein